MNFNTINIPNIENTTNLRIRIPNYNTTPSTNNISSMASPTDSDNDNPSSIETSPGSYLPPPEDRPILTRDLNAYQWNNAYNKFTKLYTQHMVWKTLTCILPFYIISVSVSTIQYFTMHEFYWFCVIMPIAAVGFFSYTYRTILFTNKVCPMINKFSYYPGNAYEYGIVVHIDHYRNRPYGKNHEFWVVHNTCTNAPDFIYINNGDYNNPHVCNVSVVMQ